MHLASTQPTWGLGVAAEVFGALGNKRLHGTSRGLEHAEETVHLVVGSGGEEQCVHVAGIPTVSKTEGPQAVDGEGRGAIRQLAHEEATGRVKRMDLSVAEVPDEDGVPQVAKARGR